jgi:hypothetical protein
MFHTTEKVNRQMSMVTAYRLGIQKYKKDNKLGKDAEVPENERRRIALEAINDVELTNGAIAAGSAPELAQGNWTAPLFLFKRFGVQMTALLFNQLRNVAAPKGATKEESKAIRDIALKQAMGTWGAAGLAAGVSGLPFFAEIGMVYDLYAELFGEEDEQRDSFEAMVRKSMDGTYFNGLLNAATGLEIGSRVGLSGLIVRPPLTQMSDDPIKVVAEMVGGPLFGYAAGVTRGIKQINDGNVERGIESMLPAAAKNVVRSRRFATEGALSLDGNPILDELSTAQIIGQGLGFAPENLIETYTARTSFSRKQDAAKAKRSKLLKQYYDAYRYGLTDRREELLKEMYEFSKRNPNYKITISQLNRSMKTRARNDANAVAGMSVQDKAQREALKKEIEDMTK